jgi:hypothetical protein
MSECAPGPDERQRREIEWDCTRLIHVYALRSDARQWREVADLFTEDGVLARPAAPDDLIRGRAAILAAFEARPPRITRHVCANVVIEVDAANAARGSSAMLLYTSGTGAPLIGGFEDRFVLTDAGWRFAERRGALSF